MPTLIPVDGDPFADPSSADAAPITFSAAPTPAPSGPTLIPVDHDPFAEDAPAPSSDTPRPLTIRGSRQAPTSPATMDTPIGGSAAVLPAGLSSSRAAPADDAPAPDPTPDAAPDADVPPGSLTFDQAFPLPTSHPGGVLSNTRDDGYLSGAAKGAATAAIKGVGDSVGAVGGLSNLADYLIARAEAKITGKPVDQVLAEHAETRQRVQADMNQSALGRLAVATDPTNVLPAPSDVSGPILARTGEYVPTSEPGKIAQAGVEAAVGAMGPGGGAISPGTAGKAVAATLARQAPAMAVAGSVGQGVTDYTGDPLLGLGAGLVGVPLAEAGASMAGRAAAPVLGGSDLLNKTPIIGLALQRARENNVAGMILGSADDPAAVRSAANAPAPASAIPNSPQTFAGQIGTDQGLLEAEKALRNTKAEKLTDGSAPTYFNDVDRRQSAAQVAALQGAQPTGDVFAPGQMLSARMDAIDGAAQDAIDRLTAAHADATTQRATAGQAFADQQNSDLAARQADRTQAGADFIGQQRADLANRTIARGQASGDDKSAADAARQAQHDALVQSFSDALGSQRGTAQDAAAPLGPEADVDALGGTLRSAVEQVRAGAKDLHRNLYNAVDPNGDLNLVGIPISNGATRIINQVRADGSGFSAAEAPLFARAASLPDVAPYRVVHALDRDVGAAMSTERRASGESPAWARLSQLKGAIKDAMTNAADAQSAWERSQVDAGAMAHEDTIAARVNGLADEWNAAGQQPQARSRTGTGDTTYSADGAAVLPQSYRTEGQSGGGSRNAPRDPSLSPTRGTGPAPQGVAAFGAASPFDAPVSPEVARSLGTGIDAGTTQEAANGDTYLLHSVQQNPATGQHTTRWLNIGPREGLSDTIEGLRSISGVKDDTPLGIASRSMMDIYRRMGVGDTPTFTVAPENFKQLSFAGDMPGGIYSRGTKTIYLHDTGSPVDRLKTAVHEGAHAAFDSIVKSDPEVAANVKALQDHANAPAFEGVRRQFGDSGRSVAYGAGFRSEFLTEAFSNPDFQDYLSRIPAPPDLVKRLGLNGPGGTIRTAWDAFKATMAKAFGIAPTPEGMSMLEATLGYGGKISEVSRAGAKDGNGLGFSMRGDGPDDPRFSAPPYDPDGLRAPPKPDAPRPQDLRAFVKARGGMVDTGGDLASMGMHDLIAKDGRGLDPDKMREAAAEAGYLGADTARAMRETHPNDLLDALSGDRPVHSVRDQDAAAAWDAYDDARERYDAARGTFSRSTFGVRRDQAPLESYGRDDIEGPGGPQVPEPPRSGLVPNFDRDADARLKRANAAYAQYARTYKNPIVGPGLRTTGYAGQYQRSDSAFIKAAVKTGPEGYANAKAFLTAAKNDPDAVAAMHDAVLNPLRRLARSDGMLPPGGYERWKSAEGYGPALRAFNEVTPGFSSRFDSAASATQALLDLGAEHKVAVAAAQKEAARQAVVENVARRAQLGQETAACPATIKVRLRVNQDETRRCAVL